MYYYQTDWNLVALRFQNFDHQIFEYPLVNILDKQTKIWLTWIPTRQPLDQGIVVVIDNLQGYCSTYNDKGIFLGNSELNEKFQLKRSFSLIEVISSTGLQIKTDPGIPILYVGFFFLMLSTLISYITYSQIWIIQKNQKLFIGGTTNRAIFDFELEFFKFIK